MNGSQKYLVPSSKPRSSMYELWGFMKWALAEPEAGMQGRRGRARAQGVKVNVRAMGLHEVGVSRARGRNAGEGCR